jgi:TRAP-type C4-dicarboxylate transport system substrate-binding protein
MAAAKMAEGRGWKMSQEENGARKKALTDNGMTIVTPTAELEAGLKAIGDTRASAWATQAGAEGQTVLDAFTM